jgi:hypothetical protein
MKKITKTVLEKLLTFLNSDLANMPERDFVAVMGDYTYFVTHAGEKYKGIIDYPLKSWSYNRKLTATASSDNLGEKREFFEKIRLHLKGMVDTVIDNYDKAETSDHSEKAETFKRFDLYPGLAGKRFIAIDMEKNETVDVFVPNGIIETEQLDLSVEKRLADLSFIDLLTDYDLAPNQIKRCVNCGRFFLQKTASDKMYCSGTCGQAYRRRQEAE